MSRIKEVNLKAGMPGSVEALNNLKRTLENLRGSDVYVLKIIHGYGSTGKGGKIRVHVRAYLEKELINGRIRGLIPGDKFSIFEEETRRSFELCPDLRKDPDLDRHNNGMTLVIL